LDVDNGVSTLLFMVYEGKDETSKFLRKRGGKGGRWRHMFR